MADENPTNVLDYLRHQFARMDARFDLALDGMRLTVLTWQVGTLAAAITVVGLPTVWLPLRIAAKVGALG